MQGEGPFSVFSSGGDQKLAHDFLSRPPREDELSLGVKFYFYVVSRVYTDQVIPQTNSRPQEVNVPSYRGVE